MKFLYAESQLFANLSKEIEKLFPEQEVSALESHEGEANDNLIVVSETLEPEEVVSNVFSKKLKHLLQKNEGRFEESLVSTARLIEDPKEYFRSDFQFFPDEALESMTIPFRGPEDKEFLKEQTLKFTEKLGGASLISAADAIIEELYMNAVLDAPREASRKTESGTESKDSEFYLCKTDKWLQISCSDFFGSLEITKFLNRMNEVYKNGAGEMINMEKGGGAGLGCVILFEHSASLILGVKPGETTKVTCLIPLKASNRQRAEMKKSLHWFEI